MSKAQAKAARRRVAEHQAIETPRKLRQVRLMKIGPTDERQAQLAADRLGDLDGFQVLAAAVDAQLPRLVLEPLP